MQGTEAASPAKTKAALTTQQSLYPLSQFYYKKKKNAVCLTLDVATAFFSPETKFQKRQQDNVFPYCILGSATHYVPIKIYQKNIHLLSDF